MNLKTSSTGRADSSPGQGEPHVPMNGNVLHLDVGASAVITAVLDTTGGRGAFRRRLLELGLLPGTRVRLVRHVPLGKLIEIEVRGCLLSLREEQAHAIEVAGTGDATGVGNPIRR